MQEELASLSHPAAALRSWSADSSATFCLLQDRETEASHKAGRRWLQKWAESRSERSFIQRKLCFGHSLSFKDQTFTDVFLHGRDRLETCQTKGQRTDKLWQKTLKTSK